MSMQRNRSRSLLLLGLCAVSMPFMPPLFLFPLGVFCIGMVLGCFLLEGIQPEDRPFLLHLYWGGFTIRCLLALIFFILALGHEQYTWGFLMHNDGVGYSDNAALIAWHWKQGIPFETAGFVSQSGTLGHYDYWNAWIYFWTDRNPLVMFLINALFGSVCIVFAYRIGARIAGRKVARAAALLMTFWPSLVLWSTQNLKEAPTTLAILLYVYGFIRIRQGVRPIDFLLLAFPAVALFFIRHVIFLQLCIIATPMALWFSSLTWNRLSRFAKVMLLVCFLGVVLLTVHQAWSFMVERYPTQLQGRSMGDWIQAMRGFRTWGARTAILADADLSSSGKIVLFFPVGLLIALLAPFPWQISNFSQITAIPEMFIFYFLLPMAWRGWKWLARYRWRDVSLMFFFTVILLCAMALLEGNAGTIFRHRSMMFCFYFLIVATGFLCKRGRGFASSPSSSGEG